MWNSYESLALAFAITDMWLSIMVLVQLVWSACYAVRLWLGNSENTLEALDACVILKLTVMYNAFWLSVSDFVLGYKIWVHVSQEKVSFKHIQAWCTVTSVFTLVKILVTIPYIWYLLVDTDYAWFLNIFCFFMLHLLFTFLFIKVVHGLRAEIRRRAAIREYLRPKVGPSTDKKYESN